MFFDLYQFEVFAHTIDLFNDAKIWKKIEIPKIFQEKTSKLHSFLIYISLKIREHPISRVLRYLNKITKKTVAYSVRFERTKIRLSVERVNHSSTRIICCMLPIVARVGFEPTIGTFSLTAYETAPIDHSGISPLVGRGGLERSNTGTTSIF